MRKISRLERLVLGVTLLFVLGTVGWYLYQNRTQELLRIETSRYEEQASMQPAAESSPAPGLLEGERININTASAAELTRLPNIGEAMAARIVDHRQEHGPFASIEEIVAVSGIGEKTFASLADYITVEESLND